MTVLEIIDNARALLQEPLDTARTFPDNTSSFWKDADLLNYFNMEQQAVAAVLGEANELFLVTSVTIDLVKDQKEYDLATDFRKMARLEDYTDSSSPIELRPMSFNDNTYTTRTIFSVTAAGTPVAYALKGTQVVVSPRPSKDTTAGLKAYYIKRLPDYSSASSISEIPAEYHEILVWGVVKKALFQQEGTGEALVAASTEYNRQTRNMLKHAEDRQAQRPRQVKRRKRRGY